MLKQVIKETVTDNIVRQIRTLIESGEFQPGEKIPSERKLTEALSVSRIAVREAVKYLEATGHLEVRSGKGTYVKSLTSDDLVKPLTTLLITKHAFNELLEVRRLVEVEIAGLAAERASEDDIRNIRNTVEAMEEDLRKKRSHLKSDFLFHDAIAKSCDNKLLNKMILAVRGLMKESILLSTKVKGSNIRALEGHLLVFEQIANGNAEGAKTAMRMHLSQAEEDLAKALQMFLNSEIELNRRDHLRSLKSKSQPKLNKTMQTFPN